MSKVKSKDRKSEESSTVQKELEESKRMVLESSFTIKHLHERLERLVVEGRETGELYKQLKADKAEEVETLKRIIDTHMKENQQLLIRSSSLEVQVQQKDSRIEELEKRFYQSMDQKNKELETQKQTAQQDGRLMEARMKEYEVYMNQKEDMERERTRLRQELELEKADKTMQLADMEREYLEAKDKIKKDMLQKIKETKESMLEFKKENLNTTTRLALLQNQQLTSELQYQSKQVEVLVQKNEDLEKKVAALRTDMVIHKEVEDELAKRSCFSKGIVKNLSEKIKSLEEALNDCQIQLSKSKADESHQPTTSQDDSDLIEALQRSIVSLEKKYQALEDNYSTQKSESCYLGNRLQQVEGKMERIATLLVKYLDEVFDGTADVEDEDYTLDICKLKQVNVKEWTQKDVRVIVQILLNQIKNSITEKHVTLEMLWLDQNKPLRKLQSKVCFLPEISNSLQIQRKTQVKPRLNQLPLNIATKIVKSNLRDWGKVVSQSSLSTLSLSRSFKLGHE